MRKQEKLPHTLVKFNSKKKKLDVLLTDEGSYKWFDTEVEALAYMQPLCMENAEAVKNVYTLSATAYSEMKFNFNFMVCYPSSVKNTEDVVFNNMSKISFELDSMGLTGCLPPMSFLLNMLQTCAEDKVSELAKQLSSCEAVACKSCSVICLSPPIEDMSAMEISYFSKYSNKHFYCTYCGAARIISIMEYQSKLHNLDVNSDIIKMKNTVATEEVLKINKLISDYGAKYFRKNLHASKFLHKAKNNSVKVTDKQPWLN